MKLLGICLRIRVDILGALGVIHFRYTQMHQMQYTNQLKYLKSFKLRLNPVKVMSNFNAKENL